MFNAQSFTDEMSKRQAQVGTIGFGNDSNGSKATLFVFTPTVMPTQILRPYVYDFNENLVDEIVSHRDKTSGMQNPVAPAAMGLSSKYINAAILPTPNGIPIDINSVNAQWSFVLVVDMAPSMAGTMRALPSPNNRIIAVGYCTEEPVSAGGAINERAVLMFTKSNMTYINNTLGPQGPNRNLQNAHDLDIVGEVNAMMVPKGTDLFLGTPQDIRSMLTVDPVGGMTGVYGDLCLNNIKDGSSNKLISGTLKSPKIQLGSIVSALNQGVDYALASNDSVRSEIAPPNLEDPMDIAKAAFDANVAGSNNMLPRMGIDTSLPTPMQQLVFMFPNLDIVPVRVPITSPWDCTPQEYMNPRNQMCSMLSASLSNLVPSCGLLNITFRYDSIAQAGPNTFDTNHGVWEIFGYGTLVKCPQYREKIIVEDFFRYFEAQLVPILKLVRGDFSLMAHVDMSGHVLLDLNFFCDAGNKLGEGFYETNNKLGGFMNPMLADLNTLNHNATQLEALASNVICKGLGPTGFFNKPIIESDPVITNPGLMGQSAVYTGGQPDYTVPTVSTPAPQANRPDYSNLL